MIMLMVMKTISFKYVLVLLLFCEKIPFHYFNIFNHCYLWLFKITMYFIRKVKTQNKDETNLRIIRII